MGDIKNKTNARKRRKFDPSNQEDLKDLGYFVKNKKWRDGCPFYLEFPYSDIPAMCMIKYTEYSLG
jgi:hypothetical protein